MTDLGPLESQALTLSVMKRDVDMVRRLLQRGVDPVTNYTPEYILDFWYPRKEFVSSLCYDDYWPHFITPYLDASKHQTFYLACLTKDMDVLRCLLQDERIRQMTPLKQIIMEEVVSHRVKIEIISASNVGSEFTLNETLHLLLMFVTPYKNYDIYVVAHNPNLQIPEALRQQLVPHYSTDGQPLIALIKSFLS